jgi:hypothetical protein
MATGAVKHTTTVHGLQAGRKYRVRVRAIDGSGNAGPYSTAGDIIAGIGSQSQFAMPNPNLVVSDAAGGVYAEWDEVVDTRYHGDGVAGGYELYVTSASGTPADPTAGDAKQFRYRGPARRVFLAAPAGYNVKVLLRCYDIFGRLNTPATNRIGTAKVN